MYQAENTNFKTNQSITQEFTRSCLGRKRNLRAR